MSWLVRVPWTAYASFWAGASLALGLAVRFVEGAWLGGAVFFTAVGLVLWCAVLVHFNVTHS